MNFLFSFAFFPFSYIAMEGFSLNLAFAYYNLGITRI